VRTVPGDRADLRPRGGRAGAAGAVHQGRRRRQPAAAGPLRIRGIPALFCFVGGKVAAQQAGLSDPGLFRQWVERFAPARA
jgi:hypothetical protein